MRRPMLATILLVLAAASVHAQNSKSVLVLHGGWAQLPYNVIADRQIETIVGRQHELHHLIFNEYRDEKRLEVNNERFVEFLRLKYQGQKVDLIIAVSPAALDLLLNEGKTLWPGVPVVFFIVDQRMLPSDLPKNFTGVTGNVDFAGTLDLALRLQPHVDRVFYVVGVSKYEQFMRRAAEHEFQRFAGRVQIQYLEGLSLQDLLRRVSQLPAHSIVFYQEVNKDLTGQVFVPPQVCSLIAVSSTVPVYGPYNNFVGCGIVGGSLFDVQGIARQGATLALRILRGENIQNLPVQPGPPNQIRVDWRQLQRWQIPESRLPAGAAVEYHPPSPWQLYKGYILGGILVLMLEGLLILRLIVEARRRKQSELGLKDLSRRLIGAQEEERRRIARELHDDLNQRMALLAGHLEELARTAGAPSTMLNGEILRLSQETNDISGSISRISHQLHSSALDILGLAPALRGLCRELSQTYRLEIGFVCEDDVGVVSSDIALCLFRLAQESLTNVVKHSGAKTVHVHLSRHGVKMVELAVSDDGKGFDPARSRSDGLGILSMRERLRLVGGELSIQSKSMDGTKVRFRVPRRSDTTELSPSAA
jgi:signal transduction histidine kinase